MGKLRQRVEEPAPEMSEADIAEIRGWEARIERDRVEGWHYGTPNIVTFDKPNTRCWATEEYAILNGQPIHRHCLREEETDVGLCKKHYEEIIG